MVVRAKRHRERVVHATLLREGIPVYVPLVHQWPRPTVGGGVVPLFPGYVFCRPSRVQLRTVSTTTGVMGFLTFGDGPALVRADVVGYLRSRAGADGVITVEPELEGREVTITDGPLRGLHAVIERRMSARQRVLVLLDLLRRPTRVELPETWLRLA